MTGPSRVNTLQKLDKNVAEQETATEWSGREEKETVRDAETELCAPACFGMKLAFGGGRIKGRRHEMVLGESECSAERTCFSPCDSTFPLVFVLRRSWDYHWHRSSRNCRSFLLRSECHWSLDVLCVRLGFPWHDAFSWSFMVLSGFFVSFPLFLFTVTVEGLFYALF